MSMTAAQVTSLLCVGGFVGILLYEPIIKPVREAIKEFNQNKLSQNKPVEQHDEPIIKPVHEAEKESNQNEPVDPTARKAPPPRQNTTLRLVK